MCELVDEVSLNTFACETKSAAPAVTKNQIYSSSKFLIYTFYFSRQILAEKSFLTSHVKKHKLLLVFSSVDPANTLPSF